MSDIDFIFLFLSQFHENFIFFQVRCFQALKMGKVEYDKKGKNEFLLANSFFVPRRSRINQLYSSRDVASRITMKTNAWVEGLIFYKVVALSRFLLPRKILCNFELKDKLVRFAYLDQSCNI